MIQVITKAKNVNSKTLYNLINDYVSEGINAGEIRWKDEIHRDSFVEVIEEFLREIADDGKITQFKALCDLRNNTMDELENGSVKLTIDYKQKQCLNTTEITYQIVDPN